MGIFTRWAGIRFAAARRHPGKTIVGPVLISLCSAGIAHWSGALGKSAHYGLGLCSGAVGGATLWYAILSLNRRLGFLPRRKMQPIRENLPRALLNPVVSCTVAYAMYRAWLPLTGLAYDGDTAQLLVWMTAFLTATASHLYLIRFEAAIRARVNRRIVLLRHATLNAQMNALKAQLDPHFLINCVNGLCHLIDNDPASAETFAGELVWIYQYVLDKGHMDLVELAEELEFVERYFSLMRRRFGSTMSLRITGMDASAGKALILPLALQTLIENALKHNELSGENPVKIEVRIAPGSVAVANTVHPLPTNPGRGEGVGLSNLESRIRLLTGQSMRIERDPLVFSVTVPLLGGVA